MLPSPSNLVFSSAATLALTTVSCVADVCLLQSASSSSSSSVPDDPAGEGSLLGKPAKSCPDFKDGPEQSACCPSQITPGAFFCCTEVRKSEMEAQLAAEARRRFVSNHVAELVLAGVALVVALALFASFLCRRTRFCPLLHRRKSGGGRHSLNGSVDSAEFLGTVRHPYFQQQQCRLMPRPVPGTAAVMQRGDPAQRLLHHPMPYHHQMRKPTATAPNAAVIADAPPPYEEFVTVRPPPPPPEAPTVDGEVEVLQNRLNELRSEN